MNTILERSRESLSDGSLHQPINQLIKDKSNINELTATLHRHQQEILEIKTFLEALRRQREALSGLMDSGSPALTFTNGLQLAGYSPEGDPWDEIEFDLDSLDGFDPAP